MENLERAHTMPADHIRQLEAGEFEVQSQTNPGVKYLVDLEVYDCECVNFHAICFCKHLAAVEHHYPDDVAATVPCDLLSRSMAVKLVTSNGKSGAEYEEGETEDVVNSSKPLSTVGGKLRLSALTYKLGILELCLLSGPPPPSLNNNLKLIYDAVSKVLSDYAEAEIDVLPKKKHIGPNRRNDWSETKARMIFGANIKTLAGKRERAEGNDTTDPVYRGNEQSGKKAQVNARNSTVRERSLQIHSPTVIPYTHQAPQSSVYPLHPTQDLGVPPPSIISPASLPNNTSTLASTLHPPAALHFIPPALPATHVNP